MKNVAVITAAVWGAPFLVLLGFFGPDGRLLAPILLFKVVMALVVASAAWIATARCRAGRWEPWFAAALAVAVDLVVLGILLGQGATKVLTEVAPMYLLVPLVSAAVSNQRRKIHG